MSLAAALAQQRPPSLEALLALSHGGAASLDERRRALIAKIGENISVRRFVRVTSPGPLGTYIHGARIGSAGGIAGRRRSAGARSGDACRGRESRLHRCRRLCRPRCSTRNARF